MHESLKRLVGDDVAETIMEHLPPSGWGDVARTHDLDALGENIRLQFQQVDRRFEEIDRRFEEVDRRFEEINRRFSDVDSRFGGVNQRIDQIESRLTSGFAVGVGCALAMLTLQVTTILAVVF